MMEGEKTRIQLHASVDKWNKLPRKQLLFGLALSIIFVKRLAVQ